MVIERKVGVSCLEGEDMTEEFAETPFTGVGACD